MSSKKHSYQSTSTKMDVVNSTLKSDASDHIDTKGTFQHVSKEYWFRGWTRFLMLWIVSGANYFAYATMGLALTLFAVHLTRLPLLVSGVAFAQLLPTLVLGLPAGILVDRYDRRLLLISTTALRMVAFALAIVAVLMGYVSLPLLFALALVLGITETVEEPALATTVPMVVPQTKLELGPLLGGLFAQIFGLSAALVLFGILTWLQFIPFFWIVTEGAMARKR